MSEVNLVSTLPQPLIASYSGCIVLRSIAYSKPCSSCLIPHPSYLLHGSCQVRDLAVGATRGSPGWRVRDRAVSRRRGGQDRGRRGRATHGSPLHQHWGLCTSHDTSYLVLARTARLW